MLARRFRTATLFVLAGSPLALAQNPPAPAAAPQGAPRYRSHARIGEANVVIEHGQPPWNDQRIGQMGQIPPGLAWRMGSEGITTMVVTVGSVFFGEELIRPGRYGFNLLRTGDSAWSFLLFEPRREAQGGVQWIDEPNQQIPATFVGDAAESAPALTVDVASEGELGVCELKWGPMRVTAPLAAVTVNESEIELGGWPAVARWYRRALRPDAEATLPTLSGTIELEIDDEDCSMNVYLSQDGGNLVALFRNQERERCERENAVVDLRIQQLQALIQQFGAQAEAQVGPTLQQARRSKAKNEITLEDTTRLPDNLKFSAPAEDAPPGRVSCDYLKIRSGRSLEACFAGKKALIRLDDSQFALKPSN
jgi:hypothetical protein